MPFTDLYIKNLKPSEDRYALTEKGVSSDRRGLMIHVFPGGHKTWKFRYTVKRKTKSMRLGSYPSMSLHEVRLELDRIRGLLASGIDPIEARIISQQEVQRSPTVKDICETWYHEVVLGQLKNSDGEWVTHPQKSGHKRPNNARHSLDKYILPNLGAVKIKDVTRPQVIAFLKGIIEDGYPAMANKIGATTSQIFGYAENEGWIENSKMRGLGGIGGKGTKRDRILTNSEMKTFWEKMDDAPHSKTVKDIYRFLLLTAARKSEAVFATWDQINFEDELWTIPGERTKNGKIHALLRDER